MCCAKLSLKYLYKELTRDFPGKNMNSLANVPTGDATHKHTKFCKPAHTFAETGRCILYTKITHTRARITLLVCVFCVCHSESSHVLCLHISFVDISSHPLCSHHVIMPLLCLLPVFSVISCHTQVRIFTQVTSGFALHSYGLRRCM